MSIILSSTTDKVQLVLSTPDSLDYQSFWTVADKTTSPMVVIDADSKSGTISASPTDITGSPANSAHRWSVWFGVKNTHASASRDVTVQLVKVGTAKDMLKVTLQTGERLEISEGGIWIHFDANGGPIAGGSLASVTVAGFVELADPAEMEAATDLTRAVPPGNLHFHPGVSKCWGMADVASNVPTLRASYNVTSITDTATGQLTVTINVDFSSANYCIMPGARLTATTYAVANDRRVYVRFGTQAAGSFILDCIDGTATTNLAKDPDAWYWTCFGDL